MYNVPNHQDIKNASEIPLALNIMPFADLPPTEVSFSQGCFHVAPRVKHYFQFTLFRLF